MSRKQQLNKVNELSDLIEDVVKTFVSCSAELDEDLRVQRFARLQTLQDAVIKIKKSLEKASPFALDPVPGFNSVCEKLRGNATQEYIANIRLSHKACVEFQVKLQRYEDQIKKHSGLVDLNEVKKSLAEMTECFRRLGSKKLYEQPDFSYVKDALTKRDDVCARLNKAFDAVSEKLSTGGRE